MDERLRRMVRVAAVCLSLSSILIALALRIEEWTHVIAAGLAFLLTAGHAIVIEEDRQRRGLENGGCFSVLVALALPPFGVALYLIATYKSKAVVLLPLYFGLISLMLSLGWGLAWLLERT